MDDALLKKAKELVLRVIQDEGGLPPPAPAGNGGLISRGTIQCAHDLLTLITAAERRSQ